MSMIPMKSKPLFEKRFSYLLATDFDQMLSFNDSDYVFCNALGIRDPFCTFALGKHWDIVE